MATYIISKEIDLTRQEGDTADIVFVVPATLDMGLFTEVKFLAVKRGVDTIDKSVSDGTITVDGQTITIPLLIADTKSKSGEHKWELEVSNDTPEIITIGKGLLTVTKELIV